ncbi:uncharacterized protein [Montipora foliosa]|uniref:uncharacterized protein n=1 Tax=Montipora foliosa TaxID=591990 RepID=UPI0035F1B4E6
MDHGHGLVDRMLIATPLAYRPTLSEMETAADQLSTEVVVNFEEYFANINDTEQLHFTFEEDTKLLLWETIDDFVAEVNSAIRHGQVHPKSKMPELIPRVATALHVLNHTMEALLAGAPVSAPLTEISKTTLDSATDFVHHLEGQKGILCQFLKEITNTTCDKTIEQPTQQFIKDQVLLSPGPVVSYRAFKHGKRSAKTIAEAEYSRATESLQEDGFGRIVEFRVPGHAVNARFS